MASSQEIKSFVHGFSTNIESIISSVKKRTLATSREISSTEIEDMKVGTITMFVDKRTIEDIVSIPIDIDALLGSKSTTLLPSQNRGFTNAATFTVLSDGSTKSVKIFKNGTLHLTGIKSGRHVLDVLRATLSSLAPLREIKGHGKKELNELSAKSISMMNWFFGIGFKLDLTALKRVLIEKLKIPCVYDREQTHCLKIGKEHNGGVTVIVYTTGKIMLSGRSADEFVKSHALVIKIMMDYRKDIEITEIKTETEIKAEIETKIKTEDEGNSTNKKRRRHHGPIDESTRVDLLALLGIVV